MAGKDVGFAAAPMLPGTASAADAQRIADSFQIEVEGFGRPAILDRLPTSAERRVLQDRNNDLRRELVPANTDVDHERRVRAALALMFGGFTSLRKMTPKEKTDLIETYWGHLQSIPAFAVVRACDDVSKNRIPDLDPDFVPTTPRIVKQAQGYVGRAAAEQMRLERILTARETLQPLMDEKARERVKAGLAELANAMNVGNDVITGEERRRRDTLNRSANDRFILAQYQRAGLEPRYTGGGILISPTLAAYGARVKAEMADHADKRRREDAYERGEE